MRINSFHITVLFSLMLSLNGTGQDRMNFLFEWQGQSHALVLSVPGGGTEIFLEKNELHVGADNQDMILRLLLRFKGEADSLKERLSYRGKIEGINLTDELSPIGSSWQERINLESLIQNNPRHLGIELVDENTQTAIRTLLIPLVLTGFEDLLPSKDIIKREIGLFKNLAMGKNTFSIICKDCEKSNYDLTNTESEWITSLTDLKEGWRLEVSKTVRVRVVSKAYSDISKPFLLKFRKPKTVTTSSAKKNNNQSTSSSIEDRQKQKEVEIGTDNSKPEVEKMDKEEVEKEQPETDKSLLEEPQASIDTFWQDRITPLLTIENIFALDSPLPIQLATYVDSTESPATIHLVIAYAVIYRWYILTGLAFLLTFWLGRKRSNKKSKPVAKPAPMPTVAKSIQPRQVHTVPPTTFLDEDEEAIIAEEKPSNTLPHTSLMEEEEIALGDATKTKPPFNSSLDMEEGNQEVLEEEDFDIEIEEMEEILNENRLSLEELAGSTAYHPVALTRCWADTAVNRLFFKKQSIKDIGRMVHEKNPYTIGASKNKKLPEIGGFLLGNVYPDKKDTYQISIEHFVEITPDSNNNVTLKFGDKAWDELHNAQQEHKGMKVVGWFHTHPGHGLFLSQMDINEHFELFQERYQVALEIEPTTQRLDTAFFTWKKSGERMNQLK